MSRSQVALTLALAVHAAAAFAQAPATGAFTADASIAVYDQFDADLDQRGDAGVSVVIASATLARQWNAQLNAGLSLRFDAQWWRFDQPAAFGGVDPWHDVQKPSVSLPVRYALNADTMLSVVPTAQWSYETGASTGDALVYGALVSVARAFSPSLTLGLGAGVYRDLDETKVFPLVLVDWRIDERWRLRNPFPGGPAGGAGLEVAFARDDAWEFAAGGTWRSERFRLDDDGPAPGGIGEARGVPLFARFTYRPSPGTAIDVYGGVVLGGKLILMDADGNDVARDELAPAPIAGVAIRSRF